jgi:hypothetical protein
MRVSAQVAEAEFIGLCTCKKLSLGYENRIQFDFIGYISLFGIC